MAEAVSIQVEGLREFSAKLRAIDKNLPKLLRRSFNDAASIVVQAARPKVPVMTGAARGSIRVASTRTAARIRAGGNKAVHYPWLDFGGRVGPAGSIVRPVLPDGRYIYPAFRANRARFIEAMSDNLISVARQVGIKVT